MTSEELYNSFKWKEFVVGDVFTVEKGQRLTKKDTIDGSVPYISSTSLNNGVEKYIGNNLKTWENAITCVTYGEPGVSFYHSYKFSASDNGCVLTLKNGELNPEIGIFLCTCLEKLKVNYSYGKGLNKERLTNEKIQLPVNKSGDLDFEAMEEYMILLDSEIIPEIGVPDLGKEEALLDSVDWDEFVVGDIFNIKTGKNIPNAKITVGNIPIIKATTLNNGVDSYSGPIDKQPLYENKITVSSHGAPGYAFYHNYKFMTSNNILILSPINYELNDKIAVFMCAAIERVRENYSYGKVLGIKRLSKEIIHLPITDEGEINFKFIEEFMQSVSFYDIIKE